jgi:hypothetical protein
MKMTAKKRKSYGQFTVLKEKIGKKSVTGATTLNR